MKIKDQASSILNGIKGKLSDFETHAKGALGRVRGQFSSLLDIGTKAAMGVGLGLVGLAGGIAVAGIGFNNMREQATIAFTTMLGDGGKAKTFLDDLAKFAAETPFEFPELVSSAQRMLAMGFTADQVLPTLTSIGDSVAALGGSGEMVGRVTVALGQMMAKGKATGEEMMQLTEAGIPAWQMLADKLGTDVAGAMEQVEKRTVSAQTIVEAFNEGSATRFGGMMEKQSHTFGGMISTLKDTFGQVSGAIMAPFFGVLESGLAKIIEFTPQIQAGAEAFSRFTTGVMTDIVNFGHLVFSSLSGDVETAGILFTKLPKPLQEFALLLAEHEPEIREWVQRLREMGTAVGGIMLEGLKGILASIIPIVKTLTDYFKDHKEMLILVGVALAALLIWLAPVPVAILAIIFVIGLLRMHWDELTEFFDTKGKVISLIVTFLFLTILNIVETVMKVIVDIVKIALAILQGDWGAAWEGIKQLALDIWNGLVTDVMLKFGFMKDVIAYILAVIVNLVGDLKDKFVAAVMNIPHVFYELGNDIVQAIIDGIEAMEGRIWDLVGNIAGKIAEKLNPANWIGSPKGMQNWYPYYFEKGMANLDATIRSSRVLAGVARPSSMFSGVPMSGSSSGSRPVTEVHHHQTNLYPQEINIMGDAQSGLASIFGA